MPRPAGLPTNLFPFPLLALAAALQGCGQLPPPPPGNVATSVPPQAINDGTLGLARIRISKEAQLGDCSAFGRWMANQGLDSRKATYLAEQLRVRSLDTILIPIPGDERMLDDAGIYVGGKPGTRRDEVEDALIKTGGLSIAGAAASALTVMDIGNGWFYVGLNGDGVVTDASERHAGAYAGILQRLDDCPAAIVFPTDGFQVAIDEITFENQSRLVRRLRDVAEALDDADAIAATVSRAAKGELIIVFPGEDEARGFGDALARIRKDMLLALEGSIEQGEVTKDQAEEERRMIETLRAERRGTTVVLVAEG